MRYLDVRANGRALGRGAIVLGVGLALLANTALAQPRAAPPSAEAAARRSAWRERAVELLKQRKYSEAEAVVAQGLGEDEATLAPGDAELTKDYLALGVVLQSAGAFTRAGAPLDKAIANEERRLGPNDPALLGVVQVASRVCLALGDQRCVVRLRQRELAFHEKTSGPASVEVAEDLRVLGEAWTSLGDFASAERSFTRALALLRARSGEASKETAGALADLAMLRFYQGDQPGAGRGMTDAVARLERAAPQPDELCYRLGQLGEVELELAQYAKAEATLRRAVDSVCGQTPAVALRRAMVLYLLGKVYAVKADCPHAEPLFLEALTIRSQRLGQNHPTLAAPLSGLAVCRARAGDYRGAEGVFRRTLAIEESANGPGAVGALTALGSLASLELSQGRDVDAERDLLAALARSEEALGASHPTTASAAREVGVFYLLTGAPGRARPVLERAVRDLEIAYGPRHPHVADALGLSGDAYAALGRVPEALDAWERALAIQERTLSLTLATGAEAQKLAYARDLAAAQEGLLNLHLRAAPGEVRAARLALLAILQRKGRVLDAVTEGRGALRASLGADANRALLGQLATSRAKLVGLSFGATRLAPAELRAALGAAEKETEELEAKVSERSAAFRAEQRPVTLEAVAAQLPEDAALLEIASFVPELTRPGARATRGPKRYVAYVLRRHGDPAWVELGDVSVVDSAVAGLRVALRDPSRDPREAARAVDKLVLEPVERLLGARAGAASVRMLFVAPDGALNLIPFGALVDARGRYRHETWLFDYLGSGRDLLRFLDSPAPRSAAMVIANPAFGASAPRAERTEQREPLADRCIERLQRHSFPPLPGTREEGVAVAALLPGSTLLTGAAATTTAVKAVHGPRVLHVATHGYFLADAPPPPAHARGLRLDLQAAPPPEACSSNALLRAGLAFAGANEKRSASRDGQGPQGLLTAMEATDLDLWGTKLVVLSACETGVGEVQSGEGVYGLRRALAIAGAESQVMSLWSVSDDATRDLMIGYYQRLDAGVGRARALHEAQLAVRRSPGREHPYYWAAFVPSGAWTEVSAGPSASAARLPPARGCGCHTTEGQTTDGLWLSACAAAAMFASRRRSKRPR